MAKALDQLKAVVARLRSPSGCPWDREQTHRSLIPFLREESAELAEALQGGRWHEMEDELGDLLFHVMLLAKIAQEQGLFTLDDVARSQALKLMRRHPHVFARDRTFGSAEEVLRHWKEIKATERALRDRDVAKRSAGRGRARRRKA
ncbi:MAG TPA: MazG nucleotide pyrophosphohydrolase domain-containing protein [Elusimicrobiota bacterium]|jgi:MazG family protein|nr:MazG nucleotide pyrophosphohydrolase domain-containing protein [Elusimicrobiota bacterium]